MRKATARSRLVLVMAAVIALAGAACGSDDKKGSDTTEAEGSSAVGFEAQWAELIAAAQEEGELVVVGVSRVVEGAAVEEAFGEQFGIDITVATGSGNDLSSRILAERGQGLYTVDVALYGNSRIVEAGGVFKPLEPELIHPEAIDRSTGWRIPYLPWVPTEGGDGFLTFTQIDQKDNLVDIYYNTDNVTEEELASLVTWQDFLDPRWKGRIGIGNVAEGESTNARGVTWLELGEDYWDQFARELDPHVVAYADGRAYADGLARGEWDIAFFGGSGDDAIEELIELGLPIAEFPHTLAVDENTPAPGGFAELSGEIGIFDQAPHPNAARLYVNWLLSIEGATAYNTLVSEDLDSRPHLRNDVPQGVIADDAFGVLGDYVFDENTDEFRAALADSLEWWIAIFNEVGLNP